MRHLLLTGTCQFFRNCYVSSGLYLGELKMFGKNKPGKMCKCILVSKLYLDFFVLLFHFHQFKYDATNTHGKSYLTSK